jgi:hypothetical protein
MSISKVAQSLFPNVIKSFIQKGPERMNLLDAFYNTVHNAVGGCEALAVRLGMSAAVLRNKANPNMEANKPLLVEADRIMGLTRDYAILHALAKNHGFVCVEIEEAGASDTALLELVAKVWSTNGEVGTEIMKALEDGRITKAELGRIHDAVKRTERALEGVFARVAGMAER